VPAVPAAPGHLPRVALLAGAGGPLGSAVLEQALASAGFVRVQVLVTGPVATGMRGFEARRVDELAPAARPGAAPDTGIVVFDRPRDVHGREAAFLRPQPGELPALARRFRAAGVRRLVVVLPHAPALLPAALKHGLATLDEHAVAALDFEQVVFVRSAQAPVQAAAGSWLQRLAHVVLAQLQWMIPTQEQPVRAARLAVVVAQIARRLPHAPPGTRVMPPELVWQAAHDDDPGPRVEAWLHGRRAPAAPGAPQASAASGDLQA
jgi:hypothetical protein